MSIWHQLRKNKGAIMGLVLLVVIIVVALGSPYLFDYETQVIANNIKERMQPPSAEHWFGTDDMGRDIFARVCYGARYSLAVGIIAVMFALVFGVTLGAAAGYIGGVFEDVTMRVCDIFSSIPSVLMAIAVVSALGKSTFNLMLAVGIASTAPLRPGGPGRRAHHPGGGIHRIRPGHRRARMADRRHPYFAQLRFPDHCPGYPPGRLRHHLSRPAQLPGPGRPRPGAGMGQHAIRRPGLYPGL